MPLNVNQSKAHVLSLPPEILDCIASYLAPASVPNRDVDTWVVWQDNDKYNCSVTRSKARRAWKKDLRSVRLTCSVFAQIHSVNSALFYDFYLYLSHRSLRRLRELAQCKHVRQHVHRLVCMTPQLRPDFKKPKQFDDWLRTSLSEELWAATEESEMRSIFKARNLPSLLGHKDSTIHDMLVTAHYENVFKKGTAERLHKRYLALIEDQRTLTRNGTYVEGGGRSLSHLTNVDTVVICGGDGSLAATDFSVPPTTNTYLSNWMRKTFHPHPLRSMRQPPSFDGMTPLSVSFTEAVFRLLTIAQLPISHLMFTQGQAIHHTVELMNLPCGIEQLPLNKLRALHLAIGDAAAGDWQTDKWQRAVLPLLQSCSSTLETLSIRSDLSDEEYEANDVEMALADPMLQVVYPRLGEFHLSSFKFSAPALHDFLKSHQALRLFDLSGGELDPSGWRMIIHALQAHPHLDDIRIDHGFCFPSRELEFVDVRCGARCINDEFAGKHRFEPGVHRDLNEFVSGRGKWTAELEEEWPITGIST